MGGSNCWWWNRRDGANVEVELLKAIIDGRTDEEGEAWSKRRRIGVAVAAVGRRVPTRVVWSCDGIVSVPAHRLKGSETSCSGLCGADASGGLAPPCTLVVGLRGKAMVGDSFLPCDGSSRLGT